MRLDQLDIEIVRLLHEDARLSFREVALRLGSTTPTVSARVKALEDIGIIRGYRAQLDPTSLGGTRYVLDVSAEPKKALAVHAAVAAMPGATQASLLPGGRIVADVRLRPPSLALPHLHEHLAAIDGLLSYDLDEVIATLERSGTDDIPGDVGVVCHQCKGPIHGDAVKARLGDRMHVFCCRQCLQDFRTRFEELQRASRAPPASRPSTAIDTKRKRPPHHR